jgi:hypothetical protein
MSLRTAPLSVRTFGPLEPSAGNGPAVSSGMTSTSPDVAAEAGAALVAAVLDAPDVPLVVAELPSVPEPAVVAAPSPLDDAQPTNASSPAPVSTWRARRRPMRRGRS